MSEPVSSLDDAPSGVVLVGRVLVFDLSNDVEPVRIRVGDSDAFELTVVVQELYRAPIGPAAASPQELFPKTG